MTPVYIKVAGSDVSSAVNWRDVDLVSVLTKEVSTLSFSVSKAIGDSSITAPAIGDAVELHDSSGIVFGGTVTEVEVTVSGLRVQYLVHCTDYSYLADGTLVHKNYAGEDPADIVADLFATFASGKGFTTTHVQRANFLVPSIKFNYQPLTKCLESLAKLIGWDWYIDPGKDVHFFLGDVADGVGDNGAAPIIVDNAGGNSGADIEWNSLDVDLNLQNLQNSVYVIGGNYAKVFTATTTPDTYKTDGVTQVWSLAYPYTASKLVVTLNGTPQSVGVDGTDPPSSVQVLYNDANRNIKFTAGAPTSGETLKAFGEAQVPIVAHAGDSASITAYGEHQSVIKDSKISTVAEAQARAKAAILQFGHPVYTVRVTTLVPGCAIGQGIFVDLSDLGISRWLVIKRVEATVRNPGSSARLAYQLECTGSDNVTYVDIMTLLLQQEAAQTQVDDSTINENLEVAPEEDLEVAEALSQTSYPSLPASWG